MLKKIEHLLRKCNCKGCGNRGRIFASMMVPYRGVLREGLRKRQQRRGFKKVGGA